MKNISIAYNSFVTLTDIKMDGKVLPPHSEAAVFLDQHRQHPVFEWLGEFAELLYGQYRTEMRISFAGTQSDCETFKATVEELGRLSETGKITIGKIESTLPNPLTMLDDMYKKGKEGPFPEIFKDAETEEAYKRATSREFEVSVIAAMSSGKSTLMNALLGRNLMPSAANACTATIVRIADDDSMNGKPFVAVRYAADGTSLDKSPIPVTSESLIEWNKDEKIPRIDITGDVPTISETPSARYVFQDTPGPNNATNPRHGEATMAAISKPLSMVLYVMKPDNFQDTDNDNLFDKVCSAVMRADEKARNRFVFVLNKIDEIKIAEHQTVASVYETAYKNLENPEKKKIAEHQTVASVYETAYKNLEDPEKKKIVKPIVIPVCARAALLIRMHRYDPAYFEKYEEELLDYDKFVKMFARDKWNTYEVCKSSLSPTVQKEYERRLAAAQGDEEELALLHTGIPLLETMLQEYLYRYALPTKVGDALKTFQRVFDEADKASEIKKVLSMEESRLGNFAKKLKAYEGSKSQLETGEKIIREIGNQRFSLSKESKDELVALSHDYEKELDCAVNGLGKGKIGVVRADSMCESAKEKLDGIVAEVKEKLADVLEYEQRNKIVALVEKYNACLKDSLGGLAPELRKFQAGMLAMNPENILLKAKSQSETQIEHTHYERHWYTLWCYRHEERTSEKAIDMGNVADDVDKEMREFMRCAITSFKKQAEELFKKNQQLVIGQMDELQRKLSDTMERIQKAATDHDKCSDECHRLQEQINWCEAFRQELAGILKTA